MKDKKWILIGLGCSIISILFIVLSNYLINPNYYFKHNIFSIEKSNPDERKFKTNYLANNQSTNNFNTILLGSSVATYINQLDFLNMSVYNYAVSGMIPQEYIYAIDYLDSQNSHKVENVIIGLDFYTSNKNEIERISSFNIKHYISNPTMKYVTLENIKFLLEGEPLSRYYYRWKNIKYAIKLDNDIIKRNMEYSIRIIKKELNDYVYYLKYKEDLFSIKNRYKNKFFIIFIPPITTPLLHLILKEHFIEYKRWVKDIIAVFGQVHSFAYFNETSNDFLNNFQDGRHFYPSVGVKIAKDISNNETKHSIILTKDNIDIWLRNLRDNLK